MFHGKYYSFRWLCPWCRCYVEGSQDHNCPNLIQRTDKNVDEFNFCPRCGKDLRRKRGSVEV